MIKISQEERYLIEDLFPGVMIKRTMKQKSKRHSYYVEENPDVKRYLEELRNSRTVGNSGPAFDGEKYRKPKQRNNGKQDFMDRKDYKRKPKRYNNKERDFSRGRNGSGGFGSNIYDYLSYTGDRNTGGNNRGNKPRQFNDRQNDYRGNTRYQDKPPRRYDKGGRNFEN